MGVQDLGRMWLIVAVLAPLAGGMVGGGWTGPQGRRTAAAATVAAALSAVSAGVVVASTRPFQVTVGGRHPWVGIRADHLTVTLLVLVCAVGAIVMVYSLRYLRGDGRAGRFFAAAGVLVTAMAVVATSMTAIGLAVGWVSAAAAFVVMVGYRGDLPGVAASARLTQRWFAAGDAALVAAAVIVVARAGNVGLGASVGARLGEWRTVVAVLVVVAALVRCGQGPAAGWLRSTVAAPTPVSALLHAGFVNGGAILLVRWSAVTGTSALAMATAFVVAGASSVAATAIMGRQSDVKGELVWSTGGQMGFMVAQCAVGAYGPAVIHLVGHGLYKATLFLGSGGGVRRLGGVRVDGDHATSPLRLVSATTAALAAGAAVWWTSTDRGAPLVVFVIATVGAGVWSWGVERPRRWTAGWVGTVVVAAAVYGAVAAGLNTWLRPGLPAIAAGVLDPWLLLAVAGAGVVVAVASRHPRVGLRLQVSLIDVGAPGAGATLREARPAAASGYISWIDGAGAGGRDLAVSGVA